jgi:hypothetical protein
MIGATEFNNLINGLPQLIELAKKFNLDSISFIKALPSDHAQLFVGISHSGPMFALDKCAKINVQFLKLLGLDTFNDDVMVMDRQSFDTATYDEYYKPHELVILRTDSEETFTTSPQKIKDFAKQVLKIDYSNVNSESSSKGEKRKFSTTSSEEPKTEKIEPPKLSAGNLFSNKQQQQTAKIDRLAEEIEQLSDEELDQLVKRTRLNNMKSLLQEQPKTPLLKSGK